MGTFLAAVLLLVSGCGLKGASGGPETDIHIYYHADDGEFLDVRMLPLERETEEGAKEGKIVITLAASGPIMNSETTYRRCVDQFNKENDKYYVELTEYDWGGMVGDAQIRIAVEVGSGGGPDLLTEDIFPLSQEIMDSGVLVNLTPYLEASGITTEKYFFGYASATSGDKIYGICPNIGVVNYCVDEKVLGGREAPSDLESLVDRLLEYPEKASFLGPTILSRYIMAYFLEGSEDLWGMVDWEDKTCDFTDPLFSKILEVTKRYREDGKKGYDPVVHSYLVSMVSPISQCQSLYPGSVSTGFYYDDGSHPKCQVSGDTLMINANTEHLEGAYAFLSYVLCKSGQSFSVEPVHKEIWEAQFQYALDAIAQGRAHFTLNEEMRQEVLKIYEDARFAPRRAETILEIVYEEAESYFEGDRSKEEVIGLIQNRVQLYLNENK